MQLPIPQTSPKASYEALKPAIDAAVAQVLTSGWYLQGEQVKAFEAEYAEWNALGQVIAVGNGTDALELLMHTLDIGPGAEVIAPTHTATATIAAIELVGATPVLVDCDPLYYTLDPAAVAAAITERTRAIVPVHLYGQPADLDALLSLGQQHGIPVLEDCAQAHGARHRGRIVGTLGQMAAFSFYPTKNLGALGDGGAIGTHDAALADRARAIAQYGWRQRYISAEAGMNTRLDEVQAAVLRCKLARLTADTERRRAIAARYTAALRDYVVTPAVREHCEHVYHLYVIRHPERDALREFLANRQIGTAIQYPLPNHLQPAYRGRLGDTGSFPVAEQLATEIVSLPLFPELTDEQVDYVIAAIREFVTR